MTQVADSIGVAEQADATVESPAPAGAWSRPLRAVLAVLVGALACRLVAHPTFGTLDVRTDIIGYPIFHGFDNAWYQSLYRRWFVLFPIVVTVLYVLLGLLRPFRGGRTQRSSGRDRIAAGRAGIALLDARPGMRAALARAALTAAASGLATAMIVGRRPWPVLFTVTWIALAAIAAAALAAHRLRLVPGGSARLHLAVVSGCAVIVPVLGLYGVSRRTVVTVASTGERVYYHWIPFVVVVLVAVAILVAAGVVIVRLRRGADETVVYRLERAAALYVSGGVVVFLLTSVVPGAMWPIDAFHEGETLATLTSLRLREWPWRDSLSIHGLLGDYVSPVVGTQLFGDSRWANFAGTAVVLAPIGWVLAWCLWVRFAGRAWPVLLIAGGTVVFGARSPWLTQALLGIPSVRFLPVPIILLVLVGALRRDSWRWALGLGVTLAAGFLVAPEIAFLVVAAGVALLVAETFRWCRGGGLARTYRLTLATASGFVATMLIALSALLVVGVLDDYVGYFLTFGGGHALTGAIPVEWSRPTMTVLTVFVGPVVSLLFAAWVLVRRWRAELAPEDWAMFAVALFNLAYFSVKFLVRPDLGHLVQFAGATSGVLMVYVASRGLIAAWDAARQRVPSGAARWTVAVASAAGILLVAAVVTSPRRVVDAAPARLRPVVPEPERYPRLGYGADPAGDPFLLTDVGQVLASAELGVHDVFDFTNSPGVFYYLLPYESPTKFLHVSMAIRERDQDELIAELEATRPAVVAFNSDRLGQPGWDGIPNQVRHDDVSRWILEHYRPWLSTHGYALLQRADLELAVPGAFGPEPGREVQSGDWLAGHQACAWGQSPSFLDWDVPTSGGGRLDGPAVTSTVTLTGWAVGTHATPTAVSIVAADGTELGRAAIVGARPDIAAATGSTGVLSGFSMTVGLAAGENASGLSIAIDDALGRRHLGAVTPGSQSSTAGGVTYQIDTAAIGAVDGPPIRRVTLPPRRTGQEEWLVLDGAGLDGDAGTYEVSATAAFDVGPLVSFVAAAGSPVLQGVRLDSCTEWQGFGSTAYLRAPTTSALDRLSVRMADAA